MEINMSEEKKSVVTVYSLKTAGSKSFENLSKQLPKNNLEELKNNIATAEEALKEVKRCQLGIENTFTTYFKLESRFCHKKAKESHTINEKDKYYLRVRQATVQYFENEDRPRLYEYLKEFQATLEKSKLAKEGMKKALYFEWNNLNKRVTALENLIQKLEKRMGLLISPPVVSSINTQISTSLPKPEEKSFWSELWGGFFKLSSSMQQERSAIIASLDLLSPSTPGSGSDTSPKDGEFFGIK